jgi:hypothetical protein
LVVPLQPHPLGTFSPYLILAEPIGTKGLGGFDKSESG